MAVVAAASSSDAMRVLLRNPRREIEIEGPLSVNALLDHFEFQRESVLVIRNGTLVPGTTKLKHEDEVEIRPVISGGT